MDPTSPGEPSRQPPSRRRRVILVRLYLIQAQFALHHLGIPSDQADAREGRRCSPITPKTYRNRSDRKSTRLNSVTNAHLVCRLLLEKKKNKKKNSRQYIK